jgi:glutathione S-transferase
MNPAGKVPVLVEDDLVLSESVAIVLFLAEKYPQKGFLPADLRARAEVNRWLLFTVTELESAVEERARGRYGVSAFGVSIVGQQLHSDRCTCTSSSALVLVFQTPNS